MCRVCFETNRKALWLAWLKCTNTEEHQTQGTVLVVSTSSATQRQLIKVRPLPAGIIELNQVEYCVRGGRDCNPNLCQRAHTKEEFLYWQWEVARQIFRKVFY